MLVQGAFARILEENRQTWNAHFAMAKREHKRLDGPAVLEFLRETLAPIVDAVDAVAPERAATVAERLYVLSLPLLARDLIGPAARRPALNDGFSLLPALAHRLVEAPDRLPRAIINALHHLDQGARPADWVLRIVELDRVARSLDELLEAGKVLGWVCGLAQFRESALDVAATLRPALLGAVLGVTLADETARDGLVARLRADPWLNPARDTGRQLRVVAQAGGFRGFGGAFLRPPRVALVDGTLLLTDGESTLSLYADAFGTMLLRTLTPFPSAQPASPGLLSAISRALSAKAALWPLPGGQLSFGEDGAVGWAGRSARFPDLAGASASAFDGRTLAITHPLSHHVFLVATG